MMSMAVATFVQVRPPSFKCDVSSAATKCARMASVLCSRMHVVRKFSMMCTFCVVNESPIFTTISELGWYQIVRNVQ